MCGKLVRNYYSDLKNTEITIVMAITVCLYNWGEHERAPHRRISVSKFDTNFTYSDNDLLR